MIGGCHRAIGSCRRPLPLPARVTVGSPSCPTTLLLLQHCSAVLVDRLCCAQLPHQVVPPAWTPQRCAGLVGVNLFWDCASPACCLLPAAELTHLNPCWTRMLAGSQARGTTAAGFQLALRTWQDLCCPSRAPTPTPPGCSQVCGHEVVGARACAQGGRHRSVPQALRLPVQPPQLGRLHRGPVRHRGALPLHEQVQAWLRAQHARGGGASGRKGQQRWPLARRLGPVV